MHSNYAPSSAEQWLNCPASVELSQIARRFYDGNKSPPAASEGTDAHAVLARCFQQYANPLYGLDREVPDDPELKEHLRHYIINIVADLENHQAKAAIEKKIVWEGDDRLYGTPDAVVTTNNSIIVTDYKHGERIFVKPDCAQLQVYGFLAVHAAEKFPENIILRIIQPRCKTPIVREHQIINVAAWFRDMQVKIEEAIEAVDKTPDKTCFGHHCIWCKGSPLCPAMQQKIKEVTEMQPQDDNIAEILEYERELSRAMKRAKDYALHALKEGRRVKGFAIRESRSNRKWALEDKKIAAALRRLGLKTPDIYKKNLISPAQAAKILELDAEFNEKYVKRDVTGQKLVRQKADDLLKEF